ncbi:MAG: very short patch repair endonuclease [Acidimicrobiales bacterium]
MRSDHPSERPAWRRGVPVASSPQVLVRMQKTRRRDTAPELALRKAVRSQGLGYRVDVRPEPQLRRRADLVFRSARVAVFVDGCFWHGCPLHGTTPKQNVLWWTETLATVKERDHDTTQKLAAHSWFVVRVWEHEDMDEAAYKIANAVRLRRQARRQVSDRLHPPE